MAAGTDPVARGTRRRASPTQALDYAERWLRDALAVVEPAGLVVTLEVDAGQALQAVAAARERGKTLSLVHFVIAAVARVLAAQPDLHQLVVGTRRLRPSQVDVCLSVAGSTFVAPTLLIEDAARKGVEAIAAEVFSRAPAARREQDAWLRSIRRWGWLVPFGWLRRALVRRQLARLDNIWRQAGSFQVSSLAGVDTFAPLLFNTAAILGVGQARDRVVARQGKAVVRPTVVLTCCADHGVWDGLAAERFITAVGERLQAPGFYQDVSPQPANVHG